MNDYDTFYFMMSRPTPLLSVQALVSWILATGQFETFATWLDRINVWNSGYSERRKVERRKDCKRISPVIQIPIRQNKRDREASIAARLINSFTCYCGYVGWDVRKCPQCCVNCENCTRRLPEIITIECGEISEYEGPRICLFGCIFECKKCGAIDHVYSNIDWQPVGMAMCADCNEELFYFGVIHRSLYAFAGHKQSYVMRQLPLQNISRQSIELYDPDNPRLLL